MEKDIWKGVWICPQCGLQGDYDEGERSCPLCMFDKEDEEATVFKDNVVTQWFKYIAAIYDRQIDIPEVYYEYLWDEVWYRMIMKNIRIKENIFNLIFN